MRASRVLLAALAAAQVAYGRLPGRRGPASTRALVGLMLAASATEAAQARGARRGALPVAAAGALGFAAELHGVATGRPFGRYALLGQARAAGGRRAAARRGGVGDDGAAGVGRGRAPDARGRAAAGRRSRRAR